MKNCLFCTNNVKNPDYKEAEALKKFTDSQGKILSQKETGFCVKHQRKLARTIKQARFLALLPFVRE